MEQFEINRLKRIEAQKDGYDDFCEACQIPYNNECPECLKYAVQRDYEAITDFSSDWSKPLIQKFDLTKEKLFEIINF